MLKNNEINAISAVPTLWRILLENRELIEGLGNRIKWIEIGSQYMSKGEKEELKNLFPKAIIVQHYGLTEASRTTLLEISKISDDHLESVGKVFGDIEVNILDDQRIAIKGSNVASDYIIDGKPVPLKNTDGWFETNDLGEIIDDYIYYRGRADDIINVNGIKVSPEQIETKIFPEINESEKIAICKKPDKISGERILVAIRKDSSDNPKKIYHLIVETLKGMEIFGAGIIDLVEVEDIPRTASGKVQRKKLTAMYKDSIGIDVKHLHNEDSLAPRDDLEFELHEIYSKVIGIENLSIRSDFFHNGGDSIKAVQIITKINHIYNKNYYIDVFFSHPTIKEMAYHIKNEGKGEYKYHLIKTKDGNVSGRNLFLIHDGLGEVMLYKNLSDNLDESITTYLVPPKREYGFVSSLFTIDEMINYYLSKILEIQPVGPFNIGGLCDGGELSYLLASELQKRNMSVNCVALIDAGKPGIKKGMISSQRKKSAMDTLNNETSNIKKIRILYRKLRNVVFYELKTRKIKIKKDRLYSTILVSKNYSELPDKYKSLTFPDIYNRAIKDFKLKEYKGSITLMKGSSGEKEDAPMKTKIEDPFFGWKEIHKDEILVIDVPGGHTSMLQKENVNNIAQILNEKICNI